MTEAEIQRKIDNVESEISNLEILLNKYNNMNEKINDSISYLLDAKKIMDSAYSNFKEDYKRDKETTDNGRFQSIIDKILNKKNQLKQDILSASKMKINAIKSDITSKKNELNRLKNQLSNISNQTAK